MTNELALREILEWWRGLPDQRRPGRKCNFGLGRRFTETYILELREKWANFGKGILNLCKPHREVLVRRGRSAIEEYRLWLGEVGRAMKGAAGIEGQLRSDIIQWVHSSEKQLEATWAKPLEEPFGLTLGNSIGSTLLVRFRWWGSSANMPVGPGGPLSELPSSVVADFAKVEVGKKLSPLASAWMPLVRTFPGSVQEVQYMQARSPWTAAYVLHWLLSDRGVLGQSSAALRFEGPHAVPHARLWLDQMEPVFTDWYLESLNACDQALETAMALYCFVPAAYVVRPGDQHLDMKPVMERIGFTLPVDLGKCCIFECLLGQLAQLERSANQRSNAISVPSLVIVAGKRRGTFAVQVGGSSEGRGITKGAAKLLYALGFSGAQKNVLAAHVNVLRKELSEVIQYLTLGKKQGNYYVMVEAAALRGCVGWSCELAPES